MEIGKKIAVTFGAIALTLASSPTWGSPQRLTYQGRIVAANGSPLEYSDTSFRFQITSSDGTCVLYYEQRDHINLQNSNGIFDISIGDGSVAYAVGGANKLSDSFINGITYPCYGGGNWTATSTSERLLKVSFNEGNGWKEITPPNVIRSVPFAMSSYSAQTIANKTINDIVLKSALPPACIAGEVLTWTGSAFICTADSAGAGTITGVTAGSGLTGGGTSGAVSLALTTTGVAASTYGSATQVPAFAVDAQGRISSVTPVTIAGTTPGGSASGDLTGTYPGPTLAADAVTSAKILDSTILGDDMDFTGLNTATTSLVLKDTNGKFANFACSTAGHVATWTVAGWACQASSATGLPLNGGTMSGDINMDGHNIINIGYMTMLAGKSLHLSNNAADPAGLTAADKGKVWFNSSSNEVKYWNGSSAVAVGSTGAAVTSLTGDVTGSGPGAAATTISTGAVTSTKILDGTITSADMDFTGANAVTSGIVIKDNSGKFFNFQCGTSGHVATWTASGWTCQAPSPLIPALADGKIWVGNAGTATEVSLSGDATLANDGTLTLKNTGTADTYFKVTTDAQGRVTSGATSLVAADIPSLNWSKIGSGTPTTLSGYGITDGVQNAGGTPSMETGPDAGKPTPGTAGRVYIATDSQKIYSDTGASWTVVGANSGTVPDMAAYTIKANNTGSTAAPSDVAISALQGTTANTFAAGNDSRITGALQSGATAGGDLSGTYPNPSVGANAITSSKIADGTIIGADLDFTGLNTATSGLAVVDANGKFSNFACSTAGHLATWTVAGWACQAPAVTSGFVNGGNSFGSAASLGTNDNNTLSFRTNNSNRMTIDTAGSVGIGTAGPARTLSVAFADSANYAAGVVPGSGGYGIQIHNTHAGSSFSNPAGAFMNFRIAGGNGTGDAFIGASYSGWATANPPPNIVFGTNKSTYTEHMGISGNLNSVAIGYPVANLNTSNIVAIAHSVGINTTSPSTNAKLEVAGTIVSTPNSISSATINLATSNTAVVSAVGGTTITLNNMAHGGNYTLVIKDTTSRTYTFSGCTTSKFLPPNGPTVSGAWSTYNILTLQNGANWDCVITWATGYQ